MPERAYKKFFFRKLLLFLILLVPQKPFNYSDVHSREFGTTSEDMLGEHMREILQTRKKNYIDYVERPSKYEPEPTEPLCMKRTSKFMKHEPNNRQFGDSTHTAWETFQTTMRSPFYQTVIRGGSTGKFRTTVGNRFKHLQETSPLKSNGFPELNSPNGKLNTGRSKAE